MEKPTKPTSNISPKLPPEPQQNEKKFYITSDIWLAAALLYKGIKPILNDEFGMVTFSFPATKQVYEITAAYGLNNVQVELLRYSEIHKSLKGRMFAKKQNR